MLAAKPKLTLADSMDLQNDDTAVLGRRLVALLRPLDADDPDVRTGLRLLKAWDARDGASSAAAAQAGGAAGEGSADGTGSA